LAACLSVKLYLLKALPKCPNPISATFASSSLPIVFSMALINGSISYPQPLVPPLYINAISLLTVEPARSTISPITFDLTQS
jgi:hypothetical protein